MSGLTLVAKRDHMTYNVEIVSVNAQSKSDVIDNLVYVLLRLKQILVLVVYMPKPQCESETLLACGTMYLLVKTTPDVRA